MHRWHLGVPTLLALLASFAHAGAQEPTKSVSTGDRTIPWTIAIQPSAKSVAIGGCQAIYIDLTDETGKDRPRRPGGMRVSLADFDWAATAPQQNAVVGHYDGPNAWFACACQGAVVGSMLTITATYPAASLPDKVRVPGLAFRSTTQLPISAPFGKANPKGCHAPPAAIAAAPIGTVLPPAMASLPGTTRPPSAQRVSPPPPSGVASPPAAAPTGPAPDVNSITGNPAEAVITWFPPTTYTTPAPTGYLVDRALQSDASLGRAQSPTLTTREWHDPLMSSGTWKYTVTAIYADGRRGTASRSWTYPEPASPQGLHAEQIGRDSVMLTWQPVAGAAYYTVSGPPSNAPVRADSAHFTRGGVAVGMGTWQVASVYEGAGKSASPSRTSTPTATTLAVVARRYRIVAEALRVTTETADQQFSADGKYDEVYVTAIGERWSRQGGTRIDVSAPSVSALHGDVSSWPPPQRVRAGSASGSGGIQHGDVVTPIWSAPTPAAPLGLPTFVLWEGELIDGTQDLLLHPMVWEADEPDYMNSRRIPPDYAVCMEAVCGWSRYLHGNAASSRSLPAVSAAIASPQISVQSGVQMFLTPSGYFVHLENQAIDRPIGLEVDDHPEPNVGLVGMWRDRVVVLSREKIEAAMAAGQNRIEMRLWDHWNRSNQPQTTIDYLNGDYTLVMRLERAP